MSTKAPERIRSTNLAGTGSVARDRLRLVVPGCTMAPPNWDEYMGGAVNNGSAEQITGVLVVSIACTDCNDGNPPS